MSENRGPEVPAFRLREQFVSAARRDLKGTPYAKMFDDVCEDPDQLALAELLAQVGLARRQGEIDDSLAYGDKDLIGGPVDQTRPFTYATDAAPYLTAEIKAREKTLRKLGQRSVSEDCVFLRPEIFPPTGAEATDAQILGWRTRAPDIWVLQVFDRHADVGGQQRLWCHERLARIPEALIPAVTQPVAERRAPDLIVSPFEVRFFDDF